MQSVSSISAPEVSVPSVVLAPADIADALERLRPHLVATPVHTWNSETLPASIGPAGRVVVKLELLQHSGSFKARGAMLNVLALDAAERARGITAISSGNHAIATAYAARHFGTTAKVVMLQSANPARVALCRHLGAEVLMAADGAAGFALAASIAAEEGRTFIHPYDGQRTLLGTASLGLEFMNQAGPLDAVVIPIGGGGLCAGMATAIRQLQPNCRVFGVEPVGANAMFRSFALGRPAPVNEIRTIADSLGAPFATDTTYRLCREHVEDVVLVEDDQIRAAMGLLFRELKLVVEPAAAAATAALVGPLAERLHGLRVGIVICGTNIDFPSYAKHMA